MKNNVARNCIVIDIGKTNAKIHVVNEELVSRFSTSRVNKVIKQGLYPHFDTHALWRWIRGTLSVIAKDYQVDCISITAHGATAALVHPDAGDSGLVLPIMDYEFDGLESESDYTAVRPDFSETFSPLLPAGLNLGRQLFWQQRYCGRAFDSAKYILPYPQYWVWRFTGIAVSEVSSWGCHTDLWSPKGNRYSSLVDKINIRDKLPNRVPADHEVGALSDTVIEQTGLPKHCKVYAGVHDSNASYCRYLGVGPTDFTVISTGTWVISFSSSADLSVLDESRDMLSNVDINGSPVACARFMGGREFDAICQRTGCKPEDKFTTADVQESIDKGVFALPNFSEGSGPFGYRKPEIRGHVGNGVSLASLYCALVVDYKLDLLGSKGDLIIEGAWLRNPILCGLLAQLRERQKVYVSDDETGTVTGAAQLAFGNKASKVSLSKVKPTQLKDITEYRIAWRRNAS